MIQRDNGTSKFWISAVGGFVLGVLSVILVLLLTRRTGDQEPPSTMRPESINELPIDATSAQKSSTP